MRWLFGADKRDQYSPAACEGCMTIRKERHWCDKCTAPEVSEENEPYVRLFLDALPAWQAPGMSGGALIEGFSRAEVRALCELSGIAPGDWPETWGVMAEMEQELRGILTAQRKSKEADKHGR